LTEKAYTANDFPVVTGVLGTAEHPGGIALRCSTVDGGELLFALQEHAVGALFASISERGVKSPGIMKGEPILTHPLGVERVEAISGPSGQPGLAIQVGGGWKLVLMLTPLALADLRAKVGLLATIAAPNTGTQ
jgi:hypothetical protein